jgi:hypothetical protein
MGVPTHRVEIRKSWAGHNWSNDYLVETPSLIDSVALGEQCYDFERTFHESIVTFEYIRVSSVAVGDRIFRHIPKNTLGLATNGTTNFLPLFNTARLDFATADSDPCRKYYRLPVPEANQDNGLFTVAWLGAVNPTVATFISTWNPGSKIVSKVGHNVVSGLFARPVQMRQLHRHKRPPVAP